MPSSDSHDAHELWARHYRDAAARRRARGLHRHRASNGPDDEQVRRDRRLKLYVAAGALFVALTLLAMFLPR